MHRKGNSSWICLTLASLLITSSCEHRANFEARTFMEGEQRIFQFCSEEQAPRLLRVEVIDSSTGTVVWRTGDPETRAACTLVYGDQTGCQQRCENDQQCIAERCPQATPLQTGGKYVFTAVTDSISTNVPGLEFVHTVP